MPRIHGFEARSGELARNLANEEPLLRYIAARRSFDIYESYLSSQSPTNQVNFTFCPPPKSSAFHGAVFRQQSIELSPGVHGDEPCDYCPNSGQRGENHCKNQSRLVEPRPWASVVQDRI